MMLSSTPALGLFLAAANAVAAASCSSNSLEVSYPAPVAADGWSYRLVAEGLTKPRSILFDSEGGLIVVDAGVGLLHYTLSDNGGTCVSVGEKTTLVENEDLNHGLALSEDGSTLYASTVNDVFSWPFNASSPGSLDDSERRTLVTNMTSDGLVTRTLLLSSSQPGTLFVSRGADSNDDPDAENLDSGRAQIRSFDIGELEDSSDADAYEFLEGKVWGWGLRNSVGLAEDPVYGGIWSVENSVDELTRDGQDIHRNNPAEELNFHGFANGTSAGPINTTGADNNYGYPLCFAVWSTDIPNSSGVSVGDQVPDELTTQDTDETCSADYVAPVLSFQAHTAPLDIKFSADASEAFVTFHGSWDRSDPVGYKISSIAFGSDGMPVADSDSREAAQDVLTTPDLSNCPDECFRPVGLAWDSKDRLWFSSDSTGQLFVMERSTGGGNSDNSSDDSSSSDDDEGAGAQLTLSRASAALAVIAAGFVLI